MPFKLKFAKMYDNEIFQKYRVQPVVEDYFAIQENTFCVADGVTRDSIKGEAIPYPKNKEEVEKWIQTYPNPSGAYQAAKICADTFVQKLANLPEEKMQVSVVLDTVKQVNQEIAKINANREIDYLANDLFGCVAVGGRIIGDTLFCFSIGDCHIITLDADDNIIFETNNNHLQYENYLETVYCKNNSYDWNNPSDRVMVRRDYRNKPEMTYEGKEISFGVLTGEKEAEHYIDIYRVNLKDVKYICAYSDGCEPFFSNKESMKKIVREPELLKNEGKERTLIIYER